MSYFVCVCFTGICAVKGRDKEMEEDNKIKDKRKAEKVKQGKHTDASVRHFFFFPKSAAVSFTSCRNTGQ